MSYPDLTEKELCAICGRRLGLHFGDPRKPSTESRCFMNGRPTFFKSFTPKPRYRVMTE